MNQGAGAFQKALPGHSIPDWKGIRAGFGTGGGEKFIHVIGRLIIGMDSLNPNKLRHQVAQTGKSPAHKGRTFFIQVFRE